MADPFINSKRLPTEKDRVFACSAESIDDFWGEGPTVDETLVCICPDPLLPPWASCPIHGNVID